VLATVLKGIKGNNSQATLEIMKARASRIFLIIRKRMCVVPIIKIFINSTSRVGLLTSVKSTSGTSSYEPPRSIIIRSTRHTRSDAITRGRARHLSPPAQGVVTKVPNGHWANLSPMQATSPTVQDAPSLKPENLTLWGLLVSMVGGERRGTYLSA
jgi:hypothetical protein